MDDPARSTHERVVTVASPSGVHLRTGKEIVQVAARFAAEISATNLTQPSPVVNLKSILMLMQLQARRGHQLRITATGDDAEVALAAVAEVIEATPVESSRSSLENPEP